MMGLNRSKGNMYGFINATWNVIKGACYHDCQYCYMKRWGGLNPVHFDEKELKTDLGSGNFIFVGSSCDMFAQNIPSDWIVRTLDHCSKFDNKYLFQTKDPERINENYLPYHSVVCTTLETNRWYPGIMNNAPSPINRARGMESLKEVPKYLTIEPIIDFDIEDFVRIIKEIDPVQVNIGADSGNHNLPEPDPGKITELVQALNTFISEVKPKKNLYRLCKV